MSHALGLAALDRCSSFHCEPLSVGRDGYYFCLMSPAGCIVE